MEEKGPFGRSTRRRGLSRSRAGTPARKDDIENMQVVNAIFNSYKSSQKTKDALPLSKSMPMMSIDPNANAGSANNQNGNGSNTEKEATEVLLFGYGRDHEWAAIDFFEKISGGDVLEDYDRQPPHQRYDSSLSLSRSLMQKNLSKIALRKKNTYAGGSHWIKVTFDSKEAADLACERSPHTIRGYLVYAERYRGAGPPVDAPVPGTNSGAQLDHQSLPGSFSTETLSFDSSMTASIQNSRETPTPHSREMRQIRSESTPSLTNTLSSSVSAPVLPVSSRDNISSQTTSVSHNPSSTDYNQDPQSSQNQPRQRPRHVPSAKIAILRPAEQALLPSRPRSSGIWSWFPFLALLFGASSPNTVNDSGNMGNATQIPRLQDGNVDWKQAGLYWMFFAWLDGILGTDICGLKSDE